MSTLLEQLTLGLAPGIYGELPAATYHADDVASEPSLSASIAATMCSRSPRHAWEAHPRLNPDHERVDEQKFDLGTAVHALLLNGEHVCRVVDAADWRTKAAQEQRDEARVAGLIPLLADQWSRVEEMVTAVRAQLEGIDAEPALLVDGRPEQTLVWHDQGVTCRARLDWLHSDHSAIDDLKTTAASAHPRDWTRTRLWDIGADVQAAFYLRGLEALTGADAQFRWCVVENAPPYAVSIIGLAPDALAHAHAKVEWALNTWRRCITEGHWPAYTQQVAYAELSPWEEARWTEARFLEEHAEEAA